MTETPSLLAVRIGLEPYPMPRPRRAPRGGVYMPPAYKEARAAFRDQLTHAVTLDEPVTIPVAVSLRFVRTALAFIPPAEKRRHRRGDGDNYEKFVLDCCSGLVWANDRQVIACSWTLDEAQHPRTELIVRACMHSDIMHALCKRCGAARSPNAALGLCPDCTADASTPLSEPHQCVFEVDAGIAPHGPAQFDRQRGAWLCERCLSTGSKPPVDNSPD
jgi:Holliday junction resolvase RusA-like endonuclease